MPVIFLIAIEDGLLPLIFSIDNIEKKQWEKEMSLPDYTKPF